MPLEPSELGMKHWFNLICVCFILSLVAWVAVFTFSPLTPVKTWLQRVSVDRDLCRRQMKAAQPILEAIEAYRADIGTPPSELDDLIPRYLSEIPPPIQVDRGSDTWYYRLTEDGGFQISWTAMHWIGSFDALMLRVPNDWPAELRVANNAIDFDNWLYVVGAQNLPGKYRL